MSDKTSQIFEELSQLCAQYKAEVPGGRRAWPVSIRERIYELRRLGLSFMEISKRSGIGVATMYSWKPKSESSSFVPVKVVERRVPTVTVRKPDQVEENIQVAVPTVTVVTPSGFRIENLRVNDLANLLLSLEHGGVK